MTYESEFEPDVAVIDGVPIVTYCLGDRGPEDRDVVLCHGTPWSARTWHPVAAALAAKCYRVWTWDMPGYGASISDGVRNVDLVTQGERLARLLEHWGLDRPHVIAHDIGGAVALLAHLFHRAEYTSLYLLDVVTLDPWGSPFFRLVAQHEEVFAALPGDLHAALVRAYIDGASPHQLDRGTLDDLVGPWTAPSGQRAFYRQIAQLSPRDTKPLVANLHRVRCRTRIGWGQDDPWIPPEQAGELATRLPGDVSQVTFPAGHLVPVEAPEQLVRDVQTWLTGT